MTIPYQPPQLNNPYALYASRMAQQSAPPSGAPNWWETTIQRMLQQAQTPPSYMDQQYAMRGRGYGGPPLRVYPSGYVGYPDPKYDAPNVWSYQLSPNIANFASNVIRPFAPNQAARWKAAGEVSAPTQTQAQAQSTGYASPGQAYAAYNLAGAPDWLRQQVGQQQAGWYGGYKDPSGLFYPGEYIYAPETGYVHPEITANWKAYLASLEQTPPPTYPTGRGYGGGYGGGGSYPPGVPGVPSVDKWLYGMINWRVSGI